MITVGVDLGAEPKNTAIALVEWSADAAAVVGLALGQTDTDILNACEGAEKVGIDAPFGWPDAFVDFVSRHLRHELSVGEVNLGHRRKLSNRLTDLYVNEMCGVKPLSVASDRIASVAMRCAGIQTQFADRYLPASRSGAGRLVEVYPAAALEIWGLKNKSYKRAEGKDALRKLCGEFQALTPWLQISEEFADQMATNDDGFDAVISALIAKAACDGNLIEDIPSADLPAAETEGWIAIPKADSLTHLVALDH